MKNVEINGKNYVFNVSRDIKCRTVAILTGRYFRHYYISIINIMVQGDQLALAIVL